MDRLDVIDVTPTKGKVRLPGLLGLIWATFAMTSVAAQVTPPAHEGDALTACYKSVGNQPRTAIAPCLNKKLQAATIQMHEAYGEAGDALRRVDSAGMPAAVASLKASQDLFDHFMRAECQREGDALMGGSGAGDVQLSCQVNLTRWRTAALLSP
jgi:uncharacterized protein YecT (DUF1311 family)